MKVISYQWHSRSNTRTFCEKLVWQERSTVSSYNVGERSIHDTFLQLSFDVFSWWTRLFPTAFRSSFWNKEPKGRLTMMPASGAFMTSIYNYYWLFLLAEVVYSPQNVFGISFYKPETVGPAHNYAGSLLRLLQLASDISACWTR